MPITPEQALLVRSASPGPVPEPPDAPPTGVDWDRVLHLAEWHRMTPLLWRYLRKRAWGGVPARVPDALRESARTTTGRNLQMQAELDRVLHLLADEGIPAMLLKGAALIETVYDDIGLRPMSDLDILVPRAAIHQAHAAVQRLGYRVVGAALSSDEDRISTHHQHIPLVSAQWAICVELHHHITMAAPRFDISGFWDRGVPTASSGRHVLPSPEDLLLHLAVHFCSDRIERVGSALGQLADMAWVAHRWDLDWGAMVERALLYGVGDRLFLALLSANELLGDVAHAGVVASLRPESFRPALGEQFLRHRVLRSRPGIPLEPLLGGRRLLSPSPLGLEPYVRADDRSTPSLGRLRIRRALALATRLVGSAAGPREMLADLRLSRWILSLRS